MNVNKMVIRFKDKTLLKGESHDFHPNNRTFHLRLLEGDEIEIDLEHLKAVFWVKSFEGNRDYTYTYEDSIPWGVNKVRIQFADGESMIGYAQYLNCKSHHIYHSDYGFFVTPADFRGNNERVFILKSATEEVKYLDA
ncbi:MAG: hypothetical protein JSW20_06610 [Nitrospiraceae bacterium]|nr:MAG: hypothetical protein JSW20_06610 [Nitrospiraceae bacterium]